MSVSERELALELGLAHCRQALEAFVETPHGRSRAELRQQAQAALDQMRVGPRILQKLIAGQWVVEAAEAVLAATRQGCDVGEPGRALRSYVQMYRELT